MLGFPVVPNLSNHAAWDSAQKCDWTSAVYWSGFMEFMHEMECSLSKKGGKSIK